MHSYNSMKRANDDVIWLFMDFETADVAFNSLGHRTMLFRHFTWTSNAPKNVLKFVRRQKELTKYGIAIPSAFQIITAVIRLTLSYSHTYHVFEWIKPNEYAEQLIFNTIFQYEEKWRVSTWMRSTRWIAKYECAMIMYIIILVTA